MSQDQLHRTQKISSTKTGGGGREYYPVSVVMDGGKEVAQNQDNGQTTESAAQKC